MTGPETPRSDDAHERIVDEAGSVAEHVVPFGERAVGELHELAQDIGKEGELEDRLDDGFDRAIHEQPAPAEAGVDLTPITASDPGFDAFAFLTIARETFLKVREARGDQDGTEADGLLSPTMRQQINDVIEGDVASHRHVILSQLTVTDATIVSATAVDGREQCGVRFVVGAEQVVRSAGSEQVVSDDGQVRKWSELWQFERDPKVDASATDRQHALSFGHDGWLFAHRGWVVTAITRLGDPVAPPSATPPTPTSPPYTPPDFS